jgi:signal transduction histidine kinase
MNVDIRTLFIVNALVSLTLAVLMTIFWRTHRRIPGVGLWALGTALYGLIVLGGWLRGVVPDFLSIVVANPIGVISLAAYWNGIRRFDGKPEHWTGAFVAAAAIGAFVAYYTYVENDVLTRIIGVSATLAALCFLCAYALVRGPVRTLRSTAVPAAALFGLDGFTLVVRALSTLLLPHEPTLFAPTAAQTFHYVVLFISKILIVFALLMMAAQRLQQHVEARRADLEAARARAEEASRAKSEFLATMSHELRTPLNAIIGFSDVLRREMFSPLGDERYRQYAADIHGSGTHLLNLITTILDISKAEAGKLEVNPIALDPRSALDTILPLVRGAAEAKRVRLSVDIPATAPLCRADPQALNQILLNLLSNAVKFTPAGGMVTVQLRAAAGSVELTVRDTGIGIAAEDLPRVMKPFEQVAHGYSKRNGGTGLGLPLVDSLVRLHGGTFHIDSSVGVGTSATVRLPIGLSAK